MFTSFTRLRRARVLGIALGGLLLFAVIAGAGTAVRLGTERIRQYAVDVVVQDDGSALVRETIDYDFGTNVRHGIFRYFPGYTLDGPEAVSDVSVRSTAPDEFRLTDGPAEIRIGSEWETVDGLHRYVIEYRVTGAAIGDQMGFDAIGTGWEVPIDSVDITLSAPYALTDVDCFRGFDASTRECDAEVADGTVTAHAANLEARQGITLDGRRAGSLAAPARTALPDGVDLGTSSTGSQTLWLVLGLGALGYALGMIAGTWWCRRAGRDQAWGGGGIDAVFGGPGLESAPIADLVAEKQVTMQFEPPRDLTAAQGGLLLHEKVTENHRVAWLTQQAIDGWITIEDGGKRLRWAAPDDKWASAPAPLQKMFNRRRTLRLGVFDSKFAAGYKLIDKELRDWRDNSELWDHEAERRARRNSRAIQLWGGGAAFTAGVAAFIVISPYPMPGIVLAAVTALLTGAAVAPFANAVELSIRTPEGFARRQLVEGFRRFFVASEGRHAREAAERDELRLYSAWAVALGEVDRWTAALEQAALPEETPGLADANGFVHLSATSHLTPVHTVSSGGSSPAFTGSSGGGYSGGGTSGGGSVGGGGGGGGGGSW